MDRKLRIGIIGTGGIANAHINEYKKFDDVEIVGGADIVPGKAKAFFEKHGIKGAQAFESAEELIKNVEMDGVSVCTYNTTHAEVTIPALEAGINVLCEKPMSFTLQQAVDMVKAQKKSGKILTIGFQPRYDYTRKYVDKIIQSGELGKIYYMQNGGGRRRGIPGGTFVKAEYAGYGCLGDIGCYEIDQMMNAVNYPKPLSVSAVATDYFGKNPKYWKDPENFNVDDFSAAFVRLEGGLTYVFREAWAMHADTLGDNLWLGTEGGIKIVTGFNGTKMESRVMLFKDVCGQQITSQVLPSYPFDAYEMGPHANEIWYWKVRDFCDCIKENRPAPVPGSQILYNQAICDGIYRSAKLGKEVYIDIPPID
ncbi:MAG TPA: Gfo/Idh/MocA family oxidoreductase [Candidatus Gallacutalibacter stercoravium]|nr:Gfo/Idh/MocA family oxidoreductase [Candidatus Gallacutalibacter stercoravium]